MKRYIKAMGVQKPADIKPAHYEYHPSIKLEIFKSLVKEGIAANNAMLIDGMIQQVIADINNDNAARIVPNQNIRSYYHQWYDVVSTVQIANPNLVANLLNLV